LIVLISYSNNIHQEYFLNRNAVLKIKNKIPIKVKIAFHHINVMWTDYQISYEKLIANRL